MEGNAATPYYSWDIRRAFQTRFFTEAYRPCLCDHASLSGTCASSKELSECLSLNFRGRKVRSPSLVRPGAWNYRVCIRTPLYGTSVAYISSRVLLLCFLFVGILCCSRSALSVSVGKDLCCFDFTILSAQTVYPEKKNQPSVMADICFLIVRISAWQWIWHFRKLLDLCSHEPGIVDL